MEALGCNQNSLVTRKSDGKIIGGGSLLKKGGQPLVPSCILPLLAFLLPGMLVLVLRGSSVRMGGDLFPFGDFYETR